MRIKVAENLFTVMICTLKQKEAATGSDQQKRIFLKNSQNSQENASVGVSLLIKFLAALKENTLLQVFSCEFCEIFIEEHLFNKHFDTAASE